MLLTDGTVQWCSVSPTPQLVFSTISTFCERHTRSSRVDSPGSGAIGWPSSSGSDGSEMSTTSTPPCGVPSCLSVRLPMYA